MTLVEIVVIIAVSSVLLGGLTLFLGQQTAAIVQSHEILAARNLAVLKMAEFENIPAVDLLNGDVDDVSDPDFPGLKIQRSILRSCGHLKAGPEPCSSDSTFPKNLIIVEIRVAKASDPFSNPLTVLTTYRHVYTSFGNGV